MISPKPRSPLFGCLIWGGILTFGLIMGIAFEGHRIETQNAKRVLIPTSLPATATPLPTRTYEDRIAHPVKIPYKALAVNPEKYKSEILRITGYVTYVYGEGRSWEIGVTQGNTSYRWENTVLLLCMECPEPAMGEQVNRLGVGMGYNATYDGVDLPVVWAVLEE